LLQNQPDGQHLDNFLTFGRYDSGTENHMRIQINQIVKAVAMAGVMTLVAACSTPATAPTARPANTSVPAAPAATSGAAPPSAATVAPVPAAASGDTTPKVVSAAEAFLATLSADQKSKAIFAFDNNTQRARWSNFPTGIFQRAGLRFGDLTQAQRDAALKMVAATLSSKGYQQVIDHMNGEEALKNSGSGGNLIFGKDEYYVSMLGTPSTNTAWMWQFGGHHFALNATIVGGNITLAPSLNGGQPMEFTVAGKAVRTMGSETDKSFEFIGSLNADQLKKAVIGSRVIDLVLGPGQDGKTIQPQGLPATELTAPQQELLLALVGERVGLLNDEDAAIKMAEVKAGLAQTYVAWSGPTSKGSAAYYRIHGPTIVIEYSPQSMGGSATNHNHSMYREPGNDYGAKWRK
jgi:hypothetical protein